MGSKDTRCGISKTWKLSIQYSNGFSFAFQITNLTTTMMILDALATKQAVKEHTNVKKTRKEVMRKVHIKVRMKFHDALQIFIIKIQLDTVLC